VGGLGKRMRASRIGDGGSSTVRSGAAKTRKNLRWQSLLAKQIRQILLPASNSFPKHGASENFGSRMVAS
jgi:hypothetical protein